MTKPDHSPPATRRRRTRDSVALAGGSAVSGLLAYVFFALATRSLGAAEAAPVSVLWSYWAVAGAVLTFSVQHWIIATLASDRHESTVGRSLPWIALVGAALSLLAGLVTYLARSLLFGSDGVVFPAMVAAVTAGAVLTGVVRGALAGRRRYTATAASLVVENGVRVAGAAAAAATDAGAVTFGVALAVSSLTGLIWARALRFDRAGARARPVRNPVALLSGIAGGTLIAQVVLTGGPVVLAAIGGAPSEVTSLFVALAIWRAPNILAIGLAPQVTGWLGGLAARGEHARLARVRTVSVLATVGAAGAAALVAVTVMPWLLRAVFGPDVELARRLLALLGIGSAVALGNLLLLLVLLTLDRPRAATTGWSAALLGGAGWVALAPGEPVERVVAAFLIAQVIAFLALWATTRVGDRTLEPSG